MPRLKLPGITSKSIASLTCRLPSGSIATSAAKRGMRSASSCASASGAATNSRTASRRPRRRAGMSGASARLAEAQLRQVAIGGPVYFVVVGLGEAEALGDQVAREGLDE